MSCDVANQKKKDKSVSSESKKMFNLLNSCEENYPISSSYSVKVCTFRHNGYLLVVYR